MSENPKNTHELSNDEILQQIQSRCEIAEKALVRKYWRQLRVVLYKRCSDQFLAEDLCQETFIIVIKKARAGEINDAEALGAFIHGVSIRLLSAHYKKEKRRATEADEFVVEQEDKTPGIFDVLSSKQRLTLVQNLMDSLNAERDSLLLKYYFIYQKEKSEICTLLQLTPEHFDRVIYRAKNRLKEKINSSADYSCVSPFTIQSLLLFSLLIFTFVSGAEINLKNSDETVRDISVEEHLANKSIGFYVVALSHQKFMGGNKIL